MSRREGEESVHAHAFDEWELDMRKMLCEVRNRSWCIDEVLDYLSDETAERGIYGKEDTPPCFVKEQKQSDDVWEPLADLSVIAEEVVEEGAMVLIEPEVEFGFRNENKGCAQRCDEREAQSHKEHILLDVFHLLEALTHHAVLNAVAYDDECAVFENLLHVLCRGRFELLRTLRVGTITDNFYGIRHTQALRGDIVI